MNIRQLAVSTLLLAAAIGGCNDPLNTVYTREDRFFPQHTGTVTGSVMLVDPDTNSGFSFPEISDDAQLQILLFKDLVFSTAVSDGGLPVRLPSAIIVRSLADFDNFYLEVGLPQVIDYEITSAEGLPTGDFAATVILDLNGDGGYDPVNDCIQFLPPGTVPAEGQELPVVVSVEDDTTDTLDAVFLPGSLMCGPGEAPSTGSISGIVANPGGAVTVQATAVLYLSMFYDPDDPMDPSDGGSIPPDYLQAVPLALVPGAVAAHSTGTMAIPYSLSSDTVNLPGSLAPGDYAITGYISQDGSFPDFGSGDCYGAAFDGDTIIALDDEDDLTSIPVLIAACIP